MIPCVLQARHRHTTLRCTPHPFANSENKPAHLKQVPECTPTGRFAFEYLFRRRGPSVNSQQSNGCVDDGFSSVGREERKEGSEEHMAEVESALAQGISSSLRTLVIASFRAPPNKFVLGETNGGTTGDHFVPLLGCGNTESDPCLTQAQQIEAGSTFVTAEISPEVDVTCMHGLINV